MIYRFLNAKQRDDLRREAVVALRNRLIRLESRHFRLTAEGRTSSDPEVIRVEQEYEKELAVFDQITGGS